VPGARPRKGGKFRSGDARQHAWQGFEQRHFATQLDENRRRFQTDVAAADHDEI
jgi:hypothetical protein